MLVPEIPERDRENPGTAIAFIGNEVPVEGNEVPVEP
jgi:hypothetical protein